MRPQILALAQHRREIMGAVKSRTKQNKTFFEGPLRFLLGLALWAVLAVGTACSVDSAKSRFILAEKLWSDGNYAAAIGEFERVAQRDPGGSLGREAIFRAAMTQSIYLNQNNEAIRKFRAFIEAVGDTDQAWTAQREIGEILFARTERYDEAIAHYRTLIKLRPESLEVPEFLFRIGRSHFFLRQFDDAIAVFIEIETKFPLTALAEQAAYEVGLCFYTQGGDDRGAVATTLPGGRGRKKQPRFSGPYQKAIDAYESFIRKYPKSKWVPEAQFGIAACFEELDQLDVALEKYQVLLNSYPSPNVIRIKLARIKERQAQRNQ